MTTPDNSASLVPDPLAPLAVDDYAEVGLDRVWEFPFPAAGRSLYIDSLTTLFFYLPNRIIMKMIWYIKPINGLPKSIKHYWSLN